MKMRWVLLLLAGFGISGISFGQTYFSKTGKVRFISDAPLEKIESYNNNAYVVLDVITGALECSVLIQGFHFQKALMQDHFNENYMESHKYPKGWFKGSITNINEVNLQKDGDYPVKVQGNITLHNVTKPMTASGHILVKGGQVSAISSFTLTILDYDISVPKVVKDNIS
ncbi:MAG TPA: YceI family protein, partial [Saprospiraceae bacterium]|nr:YceI family protein [Saprospiraceae bacterium]